MSRDSKVDVPEQASAPVFGERANGNEGGQEEVSFPRVAFFWQTAFDFLRMPGLFFVILVVATLVCPLIWHVGILEKPRGDEYVSAAMAWWLLASFSLAVFASYSYMRTGFYLRLSVALKERSDAWMRAIGMVLMVIGIVIALALQTKSDRAIAILDVNTKFSSNIPDVSAEQLRYTLAYDKLRQACFDAASYRSDMSSIRVLLDRRSADLDGLDIKVDFELLDSRIEAAKSSLNFCGSIFSPADGSHCLGEPKAGDANKSLKCANLTPPKEGLGGVSDAYNALKKLIPTLVEYRKSLREFQGDLDRNVKAPNEPMLGFISDDAIVKYALPSVSMAGVGLEVAILISLLAVPRRRYRRPSSHAGWC